MGARLVLLMLAAVVVAGPAHAAPNRRPQIVDGTNDARGGQAATDIVSVLWTTRGDAETRVVRGKRVTTYVPRRLVVTMTLREKPLGWPYKYVAAAVVEGCGDVSFEYTPGTVYSDRGLIGPAAFWHDCAPDSVGTGTRGVIQYVEHRIGPRSITFEVSLRSLPAPIRAGALVTGFEAYVAVCDPVFGELGTERVLPFDHAAAEVDAEWRIG